MKTLELALFSVVYVARLKKPLAHSRDDKSDLKSGKLSPEGGSS